MVVPGAEAPAVGVLGVGARAGAGPAAAGPEAGPAAEPEAGPAAEPVQAGVRGPVLGAVPARVSAPDRDGPVVRSPLEKEGAQATGPVPEWKPGHAFLRPFSNRSRTSRKSWRREG